MDVARAIYKINPAASYRLTSSLASTGLVDIIEWLGPGQIPTQQQLDDAWALCLLDDVETNNITINWKPINYIAVWVRNIDAKIAGNSLIAHVPQSKGPFFVEFVAARLAAISTLTTVPTVSVGTNNPNYDNLVAATPMTGINVVNNLARPSLVAKSGIVPADTDVYVRVSIGAVATTYTIDVSIIGFFLLG